MAFNTDVLLFLFLFFRFRGRNVCTHRLLNNCRYGAEKCVYSHDFTYLPDNGWWNYPEQIASAKKLQPLLNEGIFGDEPSAILRAQPKAKKFAARLKSLDVVEELDFRHRLVVRDLQKSASQPLKPSPVEKFVLLISLEEDFFTDIHEHFLSALKQKVKVARALTVQQAMQDLDSTDLIAVYLTDAGAARPKHRVLVTKLVAYTKNGGTVVAGGQFSNHIVPAEFSEFTKAWNLAWNFGSYHRTTFSLNPTNEIVKRNSSLSPSYSMKTLHASKILPEHAIYLPTESSYLQSLVFAPTKIQDKGEAPVVQAKVGRGWFGFIGDVNGEVESTNTVLAMLGLLDHASETLQGGIRQDGSDAPSVSKKTHSKKKNGKAKKSVRRTLAGSSSNEVMPPRSGAERQLSKALPLSESSSKDKPLVVVVALTNFDLFQDAHADQISALQRFAEIKISRTAEDLIEQFSRPNLHGIYITDRGIVQQVNAHVLHKVEEYTTKHGGTVVIGGLFAGTAHPADFSALFSALGLPWTRGAYFRDKVVLNPMHPIATKYGRRLPGELSMKAVHVNSLNLEDGLYFGHAEASLKNESPVLQVSVGDRKKRGRIGFIGDVNAEEGTETILLALFGLLPIVKEPPAPYQKKFIIVLSWVIPFDSQEETTFLDYVKSQEIETVVGLSNARVVELLKSSDLAGVMVADAAICKPENAYLLLQLKDYTLSGGTVVFGRFFATTMMANEVRSFFHDNWAFEWNFALMEDAEVARNEKSQLVQQLEDSKLPKAFNVHGVYLEGITEEMALYSTSGCPRLWNADDMVFMSAFVYAKINAKGGHIGFLGDSRLDGENRSILCAMLGIS